MRGRCVCVARPIFNVNSRVVYRLMKDSRGVTAIEYALIVALIVVAAVTILSSVGTGVRNTFSAIASRL
jgi:pilus assembly protein Flp/PilA